MNEKGLNEKQPLIWYQEMAWFLTLWKKSEDFTFIKTAPSQTCPSCGTVSKENRKTQSKYECGYQGNADHVAAMNILAVGLDRSSLWRKGVGLSVKQEPVGSREKLPLLVN